MRASGCLEEIAAIHHLSEEGHKEGDAAKINRWRDRVGGFCQEQTHR